MSLLFEPIQIGNVELRNRIVFPPIRTGYEENGEITSRSLAFYRRLAKGGAGLITLGNCALQPSISSMPAIYEERFLPGLRALVDAVHAEGAKISVQLLHQEYDVAELTALAKTDGRESAGRQMREDLQGFASRIPVEQIIRIQERFIAAARRAREAGFDVVQIYGDFLVGMFCSPVLNHRTDGYGGSFENRCRFPLETVYKIHQAVPDLAIDYRLAIIPPQSASAKYGLPLEEACRLAPWLVKAGVSTLQVSRSDHNDVAGMIPAAGTQPYGCFVDQAAAVKATVPVPVSAVGRILHPALAEKVLASDQADLVCVGRGLISDPEWPLKVSEGREYEIRECIMCNRCVDTLVTQQPMVCAINPQTGANVETEIAPAERPVKVLVIGAGPAGMEAARVAALRGHAVTLMEKTRSLGGQLRFASVPPGKEEMKRITVFLTREMARLGVDVRLGAETTIETIRTFVPDQVIVATGISRYLPGPISDTVQKEFIPGAYGAGVMDARDVLAGQGKLGEKVIIIGGSLVGVETALWIAGQGKKVTVIEKQDQVGQNEPLSMLPWILARLKELQVELLTSFEAVEILPDGVVVRGAGKGRINQQFISAPSVVLAAGIRNPDHSLMTNLMGSPIRFRAIGDCAGEYARFLGDAIHEGFRAGMEV